jgi:hypothetical protein
VTLLAPSEPCEMKVVTSRSRNNAASSSTRARLSTNTSRFSPRWSREMTIAAFSVLPTWSKVTSGLSIMHRRRLDHLART